MSDMESVTAAKSDQFNADDLVGTEMTVTVEDVTIRAGTEQPVTVKLRGHQKVFRPCKTVARIMKAAWGPDSSVYKGRSMTLFRDDNVTWAGMKVGGIRVSAITNIKAPLVLALQEKKGSKKLTTVQPLVMPKHDEPVADDYTIEQARLDIAGAATMDKLREVFSAKRMKPYQKQLTAEKDKRKAMLEDMATELGDEFAEGEG